MSTYDYIYNDGIQFGNATAISPTLNYYATASVSGNFTGPVASTAAGTNFELTRIGNVVVAYGPTLGVTAVNGSSTGFLNFSGTVPAAFRPVLATCSPAWVFNGAAWLVGELQVTTAGAVNFVLSPAAANWSTTGSVSVNACSTVWPIS
jgi:hypothetical protein